tara:strand:+ start:359 stop:1285 length:927 start_codon:yes stop_codon:yes gene_type:complete
MNLKKPKFWDQKKLNFYAYLLSPVAFIVDLFNSLKNKKVGKKLSIKTICVGNIYIGGTGKTSLCIKINNILKENKIKSCFIKKFYKNQIDEQNLLKKKGKVFISEKRLDALERAQIEGFNVAIFDDGLQDKSILYDLSLVCFNNLNWKGNGMTIPAGPLREKIDNLMNYKHIFLNGNLENLEDLENQILKINPQIIIHIGKYEPKNLDEFSKTDKYLVFSGIGNHRTFVSMIKNYGLDVVREIEFPDHYKFKKNDIDKILHLAEKLNCKIITTEKDYLRLNRPELDKIKFIKSELKILDEEKLIKAII